MHKISKSFHYGKHEVTFETGEIACQSDGAVVVRMGDTVLLVTAVVKKEVGEERDFPSLTVNYQEKTYAAGKIPGGYFKREGRPTEKETLTSRLIDRPLRPLFLKGFANEVQIVATVLSMDPKVPADILAMLGASAAISLSGIPFNGPLGAARIGYRNGEYLLNPSLDELKDSVLDLVVAGTRNTILMVESEAQELPESVMLGAVLYGHQVMQKVIQAIAELIEKSMVKKWEWKWEPPMENIVSKKLLIEKSETLLKKIYQIQEKMTRRIQIQVIHDQLLTEFLHNKEEQNRVVNERKFEVIFHELERQIIRDRILAGKPRIDGRDIKAVRPITIKVGLLPRSHGSALFTRGETQALSVITLGTERDAQLIDDLDGNRQEALIFHYNFLPFCVGEIGFISGPKRREIGHGRLAKRAIAAVVPVLDEFPYVIRVVSEILESNGSSSMASVCGSSLALMDAGVPTKSPVAGIAMGLIKENDKYAIISDILGDEDRLGDMDFKVAGTVNGITALQMDIKIEGITKEIIEKTLEQAKEGRLHILSIMNKVLDKPRPQVSNLAPQYIIMKINPEKIRDVIGRGGAVIREITEETKCAIDISDDGTIKIAAHSVKEGEAAKIWIEELITEVELGKVYKGAVVKITDFGAFVQILPHYQGLVHISQIAQERVENIRDYLEEGQIIRVKVIEINRQGRVRLSMKQVAYD